MEKDRVNPDGNTLGRILALAAIVVTVMGVGRVCTGSTAMCPFMSGHMCPFSATTK